MQKIYLRNAVLLDGENPATPDRTVIVDGDCIVFVGPSHAAAPPEVGDLTIDLEGLILMPGMVSGHFHTTYHNLGAEPGFPLLERPPAFTAYRALSNAQLAMSWGYTSVVGAGCVYDIDASLNSAIEKGLVTGPRMVPCGRDLLSSADQTLPWWIDGRTEPGLVLCDGPDGVRRATRTAIQRGAQIIKIFVSGGHGAGEKGVRNFTTDEIRACVEAAHDRGARIRAHVVGKPFILECIAAGVDVLDHCDDMDEECIDAMVKADVFVLPSLNLPTRMLAMGPQFGFDADEIKRDLQTMFAILPKAAKAGVRLCIGDDYGAAGMPHGDYASELALYVDNADVSALEVLKWSTKNGGALMGTADLGTIAEGKRADLLVIDGDPSKNIGILGNRQNIRGIISRGRLIKDPRSGELPPGFVCSQESIG
ncbi:MULTISPECIES: metal-dependent hydrolase family protein [Sphingobium]|uniref:metal-dependent hydrolase family protein n=1 Tax=Sphingobium sp. MI1205 TaxID=407020 RepID=UPI00077061D6|nr:amidohydrolase family protein [Sphingobium sp. MI1205]AMK19922.1 amidohydrolase [Sphingobium sp. MI1205]